MLCDECKKNEATVSYQLYENGHYIKLNLCAECAKKKNLFDYSSFHFIDSNLKSQNDISSKKKYLENKKCENCGLTFEDFRKIGKLGCSKCYRYFQEELKPILSRIHNSVQHIGKQPIGSSEKLKNFEEIKKLKEQLQQALAAENYEQAIIIRDKINKLTNE
jgi:protein arginine kinase activator